MEMTAFQKLVLIVIAGLITGANLIWQESRVDVLALGLDEHIFSIAARGLTIANGGVVSLLVYLGIRAPSTPKDAP